MKQEIKCKLITEKWLHPISNSKDVYTCWVEDQIIQENAELKFIGTQESGKSNRDVAVVSFFYCTITKIPQGLTKTFPNLKILSIFNSKLKHVEREDLKDLSQLQALILQSNQLKFLPDDLFADMKFLEYLCFAHNKIIIIEPNLLDGLNKLTYVSFFSNPCIDMMSDSINKCGNATLEEIKRAIRQKYMNIKANLKPELENGICSDIKCIIQNENLKDFIVKVEKVEFKVHKLVLAARSPVFLAMIENNVDATSLNLDIISVETFRVILNYIYNDELPTSDDINFINLFMAADKLKIDKLKEFAVEKLIEKINVENALEILTLANKYDHEKLRCQSFELIRNIIGEQKINDYLAKQTDALKTLMQLEKEKDKMDESCEFDETDESSEFDETDESCEFDETEESCEFDETDESCELCESD